MHRLRTAFWAAYYALFRNSFSIRDGAIFLPDSLYQSATFRNGVAKVILKRGISL